MPPAGSGLGSFTPADIRLLVITVAGTVLANLATVLVVGLALVIVRFLREGGPLGTIGWLDLSVFPVVTALLAGAHESHQGRHASSGDEVLKVQLVIAILASAVVLLVRVGLASGVAG